MAFAIMVGVVQVILGFAIQIINRIRLNGFFAGLMPLGTIFLISAGVIAIINNMAPELVIGPMKVGILITSIPNTGLVAIILAIIGGVLVLLFNDVTKKLYIRPLIGLWDLYGIVTGVPGDILSYIRLFALGLAGSLLGGAFNQIAFMVKGDPPSIIGYFFMVVILIIGHSINLGLAALSAFVHPLRLILLEFYKSVGFTGGGLVYSPFKNRIILKNK
jgi:V/A-type H+-transporting ATPase subunit I